MHAVKNYTNILADANKFAALFKNMKVERSKSDIPVKNVQKKDFDKALNPRQSYDTLIKEKFQIYVQCRNHYITESRPKILGT